MRRFDLKNRIASYFDRDAQERCIPEGFVQLEGSDLNGLGVRLQGWQIDLYKQAYEEAVARLSSETSADDVPLWN